MTTEARLLCVAAAVSVVALGGSAMAEPPAGSKPVDPHRLEVGVVPILGVNTDQGFIFGAFTSLARYRPAYWPYRWRLRAQAAAAVRDGDDGLEFSRHEDFIRLDLPEILRGFRLELRLEFRRTEKHWAGLGNDTPSAPDDAPVGFEQYTHTIPELEVRARVTLPVHLFLTARLTASYSSIGVNAGSKLQTDLDGDSGPHVASSLHGLHKHGLFAGRIGLEWDRRNHETMPTRGIYLTTGLTGGISHDAAVYYGDLEMAARGYLDIVGEAFVVAARVQANLLFGRPPIYRLHSVGASDRVRGVRDGRRLGRVVLFANFEIRSMFLRFPLFSLRTRMGLTGFVDVGRAWADYVPRPELDGEGSGHHVGAGGGLRWLWGEAFLIRVDVAATRDDVGFYVELDHAF